MTELTPHQQAIAYLVAAYPVPAWEPETLRLYAMEVEDIPAKAVQKAVREWVRGASERPSIAELRRAATDVVRAAKQVARRKAELSHESQALLPVSDDEVRRVLADFTRRIGRAVPGERAPEPEGRRQQLRRQLVALDGGRKS